MEDKSLAFNLEPTFRCNLLCPMCPRFSSEDLHLDMELETYERICEAMDYAHTVDFTGWGEPLLHPQIYRMIGMARDRGCIPTMTSNGTVLNKRNARLLIESGMDKLTVSIDGLTRETFETVRLGASFEVVTRNLQTLTRMVREAGSALRLATAFTIQEGNAEELDRVVPWMQQVGSTILYLKHLNVISNAEDWERSFLKYRLEPRLDNGSRLRQLEEQIAELRQQADGCSIEVSLCSELPLTARREGRHCLAEPLDAVYFSYQGQVAPCCHFGHQVSRFFEGQYYPPSSLFYGDIRTQSFSDIWSSPAFPEFRGGFVSGDFPDPCKSCYLLYGK